MLEAPSLHWSDNSSEIRIHDGMHKAALDPTPHQARRRFSTTPGAGDLKAGSVYEDDPLR